MNGLIFRDICVRTLIICALTISALVFSFEPTREFFMESTIEQQYHELQEFKNLSDSLEGTRLTAWDLNYIITMLDSLLIKRPDFILRDDALILKSKAFARLGEGSHSKSILMEVLTNGTDGTSRIDAVLDLCDFLEQEGNEKDAIHLIVSNMNITPYYKKSDLNFRLARYYYITGNISESGRSILQTGNLDPDGYSFYASIVRKNWGAYSRAEKTEILKCLIRYRLYPDYSSLALSYISEFHPPYKETEEIALGLVYNCHEAFVKAFMQKLSGNIAYLSIYKEMRELFYLTGQDSPSSSALVRGMVYYKLLYASDFRARYNSAKTISDYNKYISGEVESQYVQKNLNLAIRCLLANKLYPQITNIIELSSSVLNVSPGKGSIGEDISFWNGYAYYRLGDSDRAVQNFEASISELPDGYFALQSKNFIEKILAGKGMDETVFLNSLRDQFNRQQDPRSKLYYGKILLCFEKNNERENLKEKLVSINQEINPCPYFNFDGSLLENIRNSDSYVKFVANVRFGMLSKAKAVLTAADITDSSVQDILILKELVRNKDFVRASDLYDDLSLTRDLNLNFVFLSRDMQRLIYPTPYESEINAALSRIGNSKADRFLIYSIIRAESMYVPEVISCVGARGLMQVMPETARMISRQLVNKREVNLYNPLYNILIGTDFLSQNIESYGVLDAIAAYNGGSTIIDKIKAVYKPANEVELLEILPSGETREYIKEVYTYYNRYLQVYKNYDARPRGSEVIAMAK